MHVASNTGGDRQSRRTPRSPVAEIVHPRYTNVDDFSRSSGSKGVDLVARCLAGEAPEPVETVDDSSPTKNSTRSTKKSFHDWAKSPALPVRKIIVCSTS